MTKKVEKEKVENLVVDSEILKDIAEQEEVSMETDNVDVVNGIVEPEDVEDEDSTQIFEDEGYEDGGILTGEQYDIPDDVDAFVDTQGGEVIQKEDMTPWEIIKSIAAQNNVEVRKPASNCKFCYERGYEGLDAETQMPVPCRCIFRGRTDKQKDIDAYNDSSKLNKKITRQQKRRMSKFLKSAFRRDRRQNLRRKKLGLQPLRDKSKDTEEEVKKPSNREVNKVLKEYLKKNSLKKTAASLNLTLTLVKNIIKNNREKLKKIEMKEKK